MMLLWWATSLNSVVLQSFYESSSLLDFLNFDIAVLIKYINNRVAVEPKHAVQLAKALLRMAEDEGDSYAKYLAHRALAKAYFEMDLYATALAQVKEAMKILDEIKIEIIRGASIESVNEEFAKLNAIAGFLAYKLRDWNAAKEYIDEVIHYLENKLLKNTEKEKIKSVLGELYSIYADVLAFLAKPESVEFYERAHELLKENSSSLLLINDAKLAAQLIARGFKSEALALLRETTENPFNLFKHASDEILKSILIALKFNIGKFLPMISLDSYESALNYIIAVEGWKGITFAYRTWFKIGDGLEIMYRLNKKLIFIPPSEVLSIEKMRKREIRMRQTAYEIYVPWRGLRHITFEKVVELLSYAFDKIYLLSFSKESENTYSVALISLKPKGIYLRSALNLNSKTVAELNQNVDDSNVLKKLLAPKLIEQLMNLDENSLLLLSLDDVLHEIPWENIPIDDKYPYLGLKVPIVRIPTIYTMYMWLFMHRSSSTFSIVGKERILEYKELKNLFRKRGYRIIDEYELLYYIEDEAKIKGFHFCGKLLESPADIHLLPIGDLLIRPDDEMLLHIDADFVFLNTPNSVSVIPDEFGEHNLPICLLSAGVQTVVSVVGFPSEEEMLEFAHEFYKPWRLRAYERILQAKRQLYKKGSNAFKYYVMYGNPLVIL